MGAFQVALAACSAETDDSMMHNSMDGAVVLVLVVVMLVAVIQ